MKKFAVVLSGCGVFDGAEINEVVLTLLALEEQGVDYQCFAPDKPQTHTINHLQGNEKEQTRNVLEEAARIVRGNVTSLSELNENEFSALIVPGGFGVAKNLSTLAFDGADFSIDAGFQDIMMAFANKRKPVGYMCIAPVLLPKVYNGVRCTIGCDQDTANIINSLGGMHIDCTVDSIVIDKDHNVVTTPAYMLADNISSAKSGIDKLVEQVVSMI
ncbi:isoprenoid biosynthesis glyoxalase ElbB [Vibrio splendidus]|uniref:Glyoxalase n=1 Tax=Vibrio splendidus TaxID=29497 RepID=A0ABD5AFH4_VIBSP|nr:MULTISPECIES: isoprenoid biosynthesis glyoxalase ElbB [Vibrio]MDP2491780.1 isoprenoid biosynthesis glyoxalase ElbB [Vibrio splendidus]TCT62792.1 enhancing lycopene biosynthesis protein 2 [Vibrio crassostreae]